MASCTSASTAAFLAGTLYRYVFAGTGTPLSSNIAFFSESVPLKEVVVPL